MSIAAMPCDVSFWICIFPNATIVNEVVRAGIAVAASEVFTVGFGIARFGGTRAYVVDYDVFDFFNTGLNVAFLGNRIIAALDFYTSKTTDMLYLYNVGVPPFSYNKLLDNIGSMRNSGVELALGLTPLNTRDMELNINANVAYQYNKLISLSGYYKDYWLEAPGEVDLVNLNGAGFHGGNNHIVHQMVAVDEQINVVGVNPKFVQFVGETD
jgi:hypothetical protein